MPWAPHTTPVLLHRHRERAVLASVLAELGSGRPAMVIVRGKPDFGQDALVRWAVERAGQEGLRVLHARATPSERGLRYGALTQLLAPLGGTVCDEQSYRPPGVAEFLPVLRERPTLLALEDAQWLDAESLAWLHTLVRRLAGVPAALLVSSNGTGMADGPDWSAVAASFPGPGVTRELVLPALVPADVATAVESACGRAGEEPFVTGAARLSAGNPRVLYDALGQFARSGHQPVAHHLPQLEALSSAVTGDYVRRALDGLDGEVLAVVRALAVSEGILDLPLVCMLAGLRTLGESGLRARLEATGIVSATGTGLHMEPGARDRILEGMTAGERSGLYVRAAELAHRIAAEDRDVARLLLHARPAGTPWAVPVLCRSFATAIRQGMHRDAAAFLTRALEEPLEQVLRAQLNLELATVELVAVPEAGGRRLDEIVYNPSGDPAGLRLRAFELGFTYGDADRVRRAVAEAVPDARGSERDDLIALFWTVDQARRDDGDLIVPEVPGLPACPLSPGQAGVRAWQLALQCDDLYTVRQLARRALAPGGARSALALPRLAACKALCLTGDHDEAEAGLNALLAELRCGHLAIGVPHALAVRAELHLLRGRLGAAESDIADAGRALLTAGRHPITVAYVRAVRIMVDLECGCPDRARSLADARMPPGAEEHVHWPHLLFARALVAMADGRPAPAEELLRECGRRLMSCRQLNPALRPWRSLAAEICHAAGEYEEAERLSQEELSLARRWGAAEALGRAGLTAARLAGENRLTMIREAVGVLRRGPQGPVYTRALADLVAAELEQPGGDRQAAAQALAELTRLTAAHPASPMALRARRLAEELETVPRTGPATEWSTLSQTERHTAVLAGHGHSNRQIAGILAVSQRTVELRLSRAYRQLRITGRQELSALVRAMEGR